VGLVPGKLKPGLFRHYRSAGGPGIGYLAQPAWSVTGRIGIGVTEIPQDIAAELARLQAENSRLLRLLKFSPQQAAPPRAHVGDTRNPGCA
jgi:hypothetical protein